MKNIIAVDPYEPEVESQPEENTEPVIPSTDFFFRYSMQDCTGYPAFFAMLYNFEYRTRSYTEY
jgi:hypothetical protein